MEKTILVNYLGRKGGGAAYAFEMTKALIDNGAKVVCVLSEYLENKEKWEALSADIIYIKTYNGYVSFIFNYFINVFLKRFKIKKALRKYQVDAVYIPMEQAFMTFVNRLVPKKTPKILTVHDVDPHSGDNLFTKAINDLINPSIRNTAEEIILLSKTFIDRYHEKYGVDKKHIHVIKLGLFSHYNEGESLPMPIKEAKTNFLFFGRISKYKGIDLLIDAFRDLKKAKDISLTIAAFGDMAPYQEKLNGLDNVNVFNYWIPDHEIKRFFMIKNSVLVVPYKDASQSGVITVANLFKVPVIASNAGGLVEQVTHLKTGFLFESNNVEALKEVMKNVINQTCDLNKIVENAYLETTNLWDCGAKKIIEIA